VTYPLLLDEMLSADIAVRLGKRGHDVLAVVADSSLVGLADQQSSLKPPLVVALRSLPTSRTSSPLDAQYKTAGRQHAGLVLVSTKTFPQDRRLLSALKRKVGQLDALSGARLTNSRWRSGRSRFPNATAPTTKTEPSYDDMNHQTPPRHHRRQISQPTPRAGNSARIPGRPGA
jgi:hypothetical protein